MLVDAYASRPHYADHLAPVWDALPDWARGRFATSQPEASDRPVIVASFTDHSAVRKAGYKRFVVMEHGAGQSYSNGNPCYPGGVGRDAELFLAPNEHSASRWRASYPRARVEVVGSPRLDGLPSRLPGPLTVALAFHWNCTVSPESRSALPHYRDVLPELAKAYRLIGHGHPRANLGPLYERFGIEYVVSFAEVCERADLYICDNSSTLFEFAATGRPVVVLNAPFYRKTAGHGLRFWEAADVGIQVSDPAELLPAVERALLDREAQQERREAALAIVYPFRTGGAQRAADALLGHLSAAVAA